jgi:hypothetical protein
VDHRGRHRKGDEQMSKHEVHETPMETETFEAPELTVIGTAADVVQGMPFGGWDYHGLSEPTFEFESDDEA